MHSRTADHLFWMARDMERAAQARSACGEAKAQPGASAPAVFEALMEER